jgi:hypothetical protein
VQCASMKPELRPPSLTKNAGNSLKAGNETIKLIGIYVFQRCDSEVRTWIDESLGAPFAHGGQLVHSDRQIVQHLRWVLSVEIAGRDDLASVRENNLRVQSRRRIAFKVVDSNVLFNNQINFLIVSVDIVAKMVFIKNHQDHSIISDV